MTYLHLLHQLHTAINATMPLLLARYKSISFPGSKDDVENDPVLGQLVTRVQGLTQSAEQIKKSLDSGAVRAEDEANGSMIPNDL